MFSKLFKCLPVLALMGCAAVPITASNFERVQPYASNAVLTQYATPVLSRRAQQAYDQEFLTDSYFAAFAASPQSDWGYATNYNTLAAAREVALANCGQYSANCAIIAEMVPNGYVPAQPGTMTLSEQASASYLQRRTAAGARAMAVSEDGAYSTNWGYDSIEQARRDALQGCVENRGTRFPSVRNMPCLLVPNF